MITYIFLKWVERMTQRENITADGLGCLIAIAITADTILGIAICYTVITVTAQH